MEAMIPVYKRDRTRVDVYIANDNTTILSNYGNPEIIPTSQSLLNLLTVFTKPEKIVLHVHDDRTDVKNLISAEN